MLETFYHSYEICWLKHTKETESNQKSFEPGQMYDGI